MLFLLDITVFLIKINLKYHPNSISYNNMTIAIYCHCVIKGVNTIANFFAVLKIKF